jgi:hypothetical protein
MLLFVYAVCLPGYGGPSCSQCSYGTYSFGGSTAPCRSCTILYTNVFACCFLCMQCAFPDMVANPAPNAATAPAPLAVQPHPAAAATAATQAKEALKAYLNVR